MDAELGRSKETRKYRKEHVDADAIAMWAVISSARRRSCIFCGGDQLIDIR